MKFRIYLWFIAALALAGCEENTTTVLEYDGELKGNLVGFVELRSAWGKVDSNRSGMLITLENTPLRTVSDSTGRWELRDVPMGNYTIVYSKMNYGTKKEYNVQMSGVGTRYLRTPFETRPYLAPIPFGVVMHDLVTRSFGDEKYITRRDSFYYDENYELQVITVTDTVYRVAEKAMFSVSMEMRDSIETNFTYMPFLFFSQDSIIIPGNPNTYLLVAGKTKNGYFVNTASFDFDVLRSDLLKAGFKPNTEVYCASFGTTNFCYDKYFDHKLSKFVYVGLSPFRTETKRFTFR